MKETPKTTVRARELLRDILPDVELVKVGAPVFFPEMERWVEKGVGRQPSLLGSYPKTARRAEFADPSHLRETARLEGWVTLYVYEVAGYPEGPLLLRYAVDV